MKKQVSSFYVMNRLKSVYKMAIYFNFMKFYFWYFVLSNIFYLVPGQDVNLETFRSLNDINQEWLQHTSHPEIARLLQLPPYIYHTNVDGLTSGFNIFDLLEGKNESRNATLEYIEKGKCSDDIIQIAESYSSQWALQSEYLNDFI